MSKLLQLVVDVHTEHIRMCIKRLLLHGAAQSNTGASRSQPSVPKATQELHALSPVFGQLARRGVADHMQTPKAVPVGEKQQVLLITELVS